MASHELRTPLTPLKLHLAQLRRMSHEGEGSNVRMDALDRQVTRLSRLVDELLDISRMSSGRWSVHREPADLSSIVRDVLVGLHADLERSGSAVQIEAERSVIGEWDPVRLYQAVANLLNNALKFGAGKPIEVSVRATPQHAEIEVRDHRVGISIGDQRKIFDPSNGRRRRATSPGSGWGCTSSARSWMPTAAPSASAAAPARAPAL